jgi:hypothetical protein
MKEMKRIKGAERPEKFVEGVDYYFENALMILTEGFLLKRGYCCGNGCRHCPYKVIDGEIHNKKVSNSSL